jgi:hypothetical protein
MVVKGISFNALRELSVGLWKGNDILYRAGLKYWRGPQAEHSTIRTLTYLLLTSFDVCVSLMCSCISAECRSFLVMCYPL